MKTISASVVGVAVGVGVDVGVRAKVGEGADVGSDCVGTGVGVAVGTGVGLAVGTGVGLAEGVTVGDGATVGSGAAMDVSWGAGVGVKVGVGICVAVGSGAVVGVGASDRVGSSPQADMNNAVRQKDNSIAIKTAVLLRLKCKAVPGNLLSSTMFEFGPEKEPWKRAMRREAHISAGLPPIAEGQGFRGHAVQSAAVRDRRTPGRRHRSIGRLNAKRKSLPRIGSHMRFMRE